MRRNLNQYIVELLEIHDCVILPSLGAFIRSVKPAFWDKDEYSITPISKTLVFNKNLLYEDGLLGAHIAKENNISYQAATEWLRFQIKQIYQKINQGESFVLICLGTLFRKENNIVFIRDVNFQFSFESFGLDPIQITQKLQVSKDDVSEIKSNFNNLKNIYTMIKKTKKKSNKGNYIVLIFPAIVLLTIGGYFLFFHKKKLTTEIANYKTDQPILDIPEEVEDFENETENSWVEKLEKPISEPTLHTEDDQTHITKQNKEIFYLIAGVYKEKKNALHMVDSLKSSGFPTAVILGQINEKYRVSFTKEGYSSIEAIKKEKNRLEEMGYNSWILEKK